MRDKPDLQPHRMPASPAGEKNAMSAVIPHPAVPLSAVFADTFFLAASLKKKKVFKACVLYICTLTKLAHLEPASFGDEDRPSSETDEAAVFASLGKYGTLAAYPTSKWSKFAPTEGASGAARLRRGPRTNKRRIQACTHIR